MITGDDEAHREDGREAGKDVALAEGSRTAARFQTARIIRLHREEQQRRQVGVIADLHILVELHSRQNLLNGHLVKEVGLGRTVLISTETAHTLLTKTKSKERMTDTQRSTRSLNIT